MSTVARKIRETIQAWNAETSAKDPRDPRVQDIELRAKHAEALKAQEQTAGLLPPMSEVVANMRRCIDEAAGSFHKDHGYGVAHAFAGDWSLATDGRLELRSQPGLANFNLPGAQLTVANLCAFFPEQMKDAFARAIAAKYSELNKSDIGTTFKNRPQEYEAANQQIREIEEAHSLVVDCAAELNPPIVLELLPGVARRRRAEKDQAERTAAARKAAGQGPALRGSSSPDIDQASNREPW